MTDDKQKPDENLRWAVIRGTRQKIISTYEKQWEADYYGRSTLPLRGWASYKVRPVKLVFLDEEK
jgi:hypothetical protein